MRELNYNKNASNEIIIEKKIGDNMNEERNNISGSEKDNKVIEKNDKMEVDEDIESKNDENKNILVNTYKIHKEDYSTTENIIKLLKNLFPKILENYEIKEYIGSGSESVVFKVVLKRTNKAYAMKIIFYEESERRNINELNISNKFKHNNMDFMKLKKMR